MVSRLTYSLLKGFSSLGSVVAASIRCNADTCTLPRQIGKMVVDCNCHSTYPVAAAVLDCKVCGGFVDLLEKSIQLRKPSNDTVFLEMSAILISYEWIRDNFLGFKKIEVFSDCKPAVDILLEKTFNPTYKQSLLRFRNLSKVVGRRAVLAAVSRDLTLPAHWVGRYGGHFYLRLRQIEDTLERYGVRVKSFLKNMVADMYVGDKLGTFTSNGFAERVEGTFLIVVFPQVFPEQSVDGRSGSSSSSGELIKFLEKKRNVAKHLFNVNKVVVYEADELRIAREGERKSLKTLSMPDGKKFIVMILFKRFADEEDLKFIGEGSATFPIVEEEFLNQYVGGGHYFYRVKVLKDSTIRKKDLDGCTLNLRVTKILSE